MKIKSRLFGFDVLPIRLLFSTLIVVYTCALIRSFVHSSIRSL